MLSFPRGQHRQQTPRALCIALLLCSTRVGVNEIAADHTADDPLTDVDGESQPVGRSLLQDQSHRIKGPLRVVPNCHKCKMQRIPDMCSYLPGTEPAGSTYDDEFRGSTAPLTQAIGVQHFTAPQDQVPLTRPAAVVVTEQRRNTALNLRKHRSVRGRLQASPAGRSIELRGNVNGAEIPTEELEETLHDDGDFLDLQQGGLGGTEELEQVAVAEWAAPESPQIGQRQVSGRGFFSNLMGRIGSGDGRSGRRRLLRAKGGGKKGGPMRQPVFYPPGPLTTEALRRVLSNWKKNPNRCGMWTRDCVRRYIAGEDLGLAMHFNDTTMLPRKNPLLATLMDNVLPAGKDVLDMYPDLKPGSLGSCAVVAVGDNLLQAKRGREIDAHDTVFRYNSPIRKYASAVGTKSDVVYWKMRNDEKDYGQEGQKASRFYMWKEAKKFWEFGSMKDWVENKFKGLPLLWPTGLANDAWVVYTLYKQERKVSVGTQPGGFKLVLDVLASGLCKRLDIYGYTARGSGKYFKRESFMKATHISGLDHWVYREAQAMGLLCAYD